MLTFEPINYQHLIDARALGWGGWEGWSRSRLYYLSMLGYAAYLDGSLSGVGAVYWIGGKASGRALGCFALDEKFRADRRSRWVHRRAIEVLDLAHRIAPEIYADLDPDIPNALKFIKRLGFVEKSGEWVRYGRGSSVDTESRLVHSQ